MPCYRINEVDARDPDVAATLHAFNALVPSVFPPLEERHLDSGYWWLAYCSMQSYREEALAGEYVKEGLPMEEAVRMAAAAEQPVAFAGLVAFDPFPNVGYCKRCWVSPDHHGHGIQYRMLMARCLKAKQIGWTMLVSECSADNSFSANNFRKAGFDLVEPEQKWGAADSIYWIKKL